MGTITIQAKVTGIPNTNQVSLEYMKPNKQNTKLTVAKTNHNMKLGEQVIVTTRNTEPYAFIGVNKINAPAPKPVPIPKPAPTPAPKPAPKPATDASAETRASACTETRT